MEKKFEKKISNKSNKILLCEKNNNKKRRKNSNKINLIENKSKKKNFPKQFKVVENRGLGKKVETKKQNIFAAKNLEKKNEKKHLEKKNEKKQFGKKNILEIFFFLFSRERGVNYSANSGNQK